MAHRKYARSEVLGVKSSAERAAAPSLSAFSSFDDYKTDDGFLYVRVRAISSRVNKNHDGWPSEELSKAYRTFVGKPIFVDHHNTDPKKARGVVVDAALHVEDDLDKTASLDPYYASAPENHLPPTWIELLLEVDAKRYPKLAKAIVAGDIDGVSMGANVERSICSHCANVARSPEEYCTHVRSKGAYFDYYGPDGTKTSKKAYEDCYDIGFFELSFVFDPADETALKIDHKMAARRQAMVDVYAETDGPRTAMAKVAAALEPVPEWEGEPAELGEPYNPENLAEAPAGDDEAATARAWRVEQYIRAGYTPEEAEALADATAGHPGQTGEGNVYPDVMRTIEQGATPDQARRIWARTHGLEIDTAVADDEFLWSKTAEQNPPPQSDMTTAPEDVDTLRQDKTCPICGSDMEDGICEVCNYEEPPEGFDNPDLEKAKETDLREEQQAGEEALQQTQAQTPGAATPGEGSQMGPEGAPGMTQPIQASTAFPAAADPVTDDKTSERTAARTNTQERPILPATRKLTDKPKNPKTVKDSKQPVESNRKDKMTETTQKVADGATPVGEGVQADKRVDVEGVGATSPDPLSGIEHQNVETETADFTAPKTDTWSGEEGDSLQSADAVTSDTGDFATVSSTEKTADEKTADIEVIETIPSGNGFPDHDPSHVDLEALLAEEVGDRTETDSTGTAFRSLEQAPAVTKGESGNDLGGPVGVALAKAQLLKAVKVAEAEVDLGLIEAEAKFDRVAELEETPAEALDATLEALAKVKTAGLRRPKAASQRTASAGRMPSFRAPGEGFLVEAAATDAEIDRQVEDAIF